MIEGGVLFRVSKDGLWPRKADYVLKTGMWGGSECFIIGGGESLKDFDFSKLDGKFTIGINRAIEAYDSTLWYGMDWRFLKHLENGEVSMERWNGFKGKKIFSMPEFDGIFPGDLYFIKRIYDGIVNGTIENGIDPGTNSGYGALMLAIALGANPIFLLGFDMTVRERTHWHKGYSGQTLADQKWRTERFIDSFNRAAPTIKALGFNVYNLCPDSKLQCFTKLEAESVFRQPAAVCEKSEFHDLYY